MTNAQPSKNRVRPMATFTLSRELIDAIANAVRGGNKSALVETLLRKALKLPPMAK